MARKKAPKKKPKPRTNRTPKKRTAPDWSVRFLAELSLRGNISAACDAAGVGRTTVYDRRDAEPKFAAAMADAIERSTDALELEARRRAHDGLRRYKFHKDEPVIDPRTGEQFYEHEYSDTLLIFLLKAHRPEKFRENVKVEHSGQLKHTHEDLSDAELDARIARLEAGATAAPGGTSTPPGPG